jgi:hypothetical protein
MNCDEFGEIVHELARPARAKNLDPAASAAARAHARICPECADWLAEAELAAKGLEVAAAESRLLRPSPEIETELLAALRQEKESARRAGARVWQRWLTALGLAAAAAAASFTVVVLVHRVPRVAAPAGHATSSLRAARVEAGAQLRPVATTASPSALPAAELGSGFVPVPYAGGFMQGDAAVIVRVQLRRGDLAELGYPVDASAAGDLVRADLLVGEDGWPYAVRIVP